MTSRVDRRLAQALESLAAIRLPKAQLNERSALCLLALLDLPPGKSWAQAASPLIGITPIMDWARLHFRKDYAPNTRETFRRHSMHPFVAAGIALYNPDDPARAPNSPKAVYQISPAALEVFRAIGTRRWQPAVAEFLRQQGSLAARYAGERAQRLVPVRLPSGVAARLSSGAHSELIKAVIESFAPRFAPDAALLYLGDTGNRSVHFDRRALAALGVVVGPQSKLPDVVLHLASKNWLLLVEAVSSHGPVNAKRHAELAQQFAGSSAGLVFVSAFADRASLAKFVSGIAWETEAWTADAPSHLIHFNGERFLGPYADSNGARP